MNDNTFVNHPPEVEVPADNRPLVAPIYQSVKFTFDDVGETLRTLRGEREGFFYSRNTNPTLRQLELTLEILLGNFEILQGHVRALVTEELHDAGKADARQ